MKRILLLTALLLSSVGCSTATSAGESSSSSPRIATRRDVITQEEIIGAGATNLFEVVQRLRPAWLRSSSPSNFSGGGTGIVVYQNDTQLGGLDALRQLNTGFASSLKYLDGVEASNTLPGLGSRKVSGAIVVLTSNHRH